jgi:hypothetical protein
VKHDSPPILPAPAPNRASDIRCLALLAGLILLGHGGSLFDGLFFDDHWHRVALRSAAWTWNDLIESATFDLPGHLANLWWQDRPLQWRYARPVAMAVMKAEQTLAGGDPRIVHGFALLWHWLATALVYCIGAWALQRRSLALIAAAVFALHPHAVFALGWTAARNALVGGVLFLAALQFYARGSFVGRGADAPSRPLLALAWICWLLALFCRETAVVVPLLLPILDLSAGGWTLVRRRWLFHSFFALTAAAYLYWRLAIFPTSVPPEIYFTAPAGPAYALWAAAKLLHMLFSNAVFTPMFLGLATFGGSSPDAWIEYAVMLAILTALTAGYCLATRGGRFRNFWLIWIVAAFLPVVPVFVMPHFAYLAAPAFGLAVAGVVARLPRNWGVALAAFVLAASTWSTVLYRYIWRGIVRSEQLVYADILRTTRASDLPWAGSDKPKLFFVNLPVCGIYGSVALRDTWNREDVTGHVLTFSDSPLMMTEPSGLYVLNDHEFELSMKWGSYFSGLAGRMLLEGMRSTPLAVGKSIVGPQFTATILDADATGVRRLRFTFPKPLDSPEYFFYMSTPERPAARLQFAGDRFDLAPAPAPRREFNDWLAERELYFRILNVTRRFVRSDLFLTGK